MAAAAGVPTTLISGYSATQGRRLLAGTNVLYTVLVPSSTSSTSSSSGSVASGSGSSSGSSSSSGCFAATETVTLESGASKAMSEVTVGDRILTVNAQTGALVYSDVAYLPHGQNAVKVRLWPAWT